MDYSALTKKDKQDIFEIVNSIHLNLKGDQKKLLKSSFCNLWKINKSVGAFELMMKLYESEAVYDKMNEAFLKCVKDGSDNEYYRNKKNVPYAKYMQHLQWKTVDVEKAEQDLEDIKEGNGYMTQEQHNEILQLNISKYHETIREQGDLIARLRNQLRDKDTIIEGKKKTIEERRIYYEGQLAIAYQK